MFQTFFLVVLPGIAPYVAIGVASAWLERWLTPRIRRERAQRQALSRSTQQAKAYRDQARPLLDQLYVAMEMDPSLKAAIPPDLQEQLLQLTTHSEESR